MSHTTRLRPVLLLIVVALAMLLPGRMRLPPMDRDESRYLQATTQMLQTGNLVDIRFQDQPRYLQPAGIYWLEVASVRLLSHSGQVPAAVWVYRIPSLLSGIAALLLTAWIGRALFGVRSGLSAYLMLGCWFLFGVYVRLAKIDATLLAAVLAAQASLLRLFLDREADRASRWPVAAMHWAALGCGLMLKGPVALLPSWGTLLGLALAERQIGWWRRLQPSWGVPLMLAIVLPWCVAIGIASHGDFFQRAVGHNFIGKVASGQEAHGQPPGFHLLLFSLTFWPGSLFAVLAIPFTWRMRRSPSVRFLLAWIVPCWLVFEAIATKLPHYVLPTFPALACLAAAALHAEHGRMGKDAPRWVWVRRIYTGLWLTLTLALALAGPALLMGLQSPRRLGPVANSAALSVVVIAAGIMTVVALYRRHTGQALAAICAAGFAMMLNAYECVLPYLDQIWLSPKIAAEVAIQRPCPDTVLSSTSYSEPSLVFLLGGRARLVGAPTAAQDLARDPRCAMALVGQQDQRAFLHELGPSGVVPRRLATIAGINYSTGRRLSLDLYSATSADKP